jgi:methylisocitrate lyase
VNVLVSSDFTTVSALAQLGVRRISVGGALARAAWGILSATETPSAHVAQLGHAVPFTEINGRFVGGKR